MSLAIVLAILSRIPSSSSFKEDLISSGVPSTSQFLNLFSTYSIIVFCAADAQLWQPYLGLLFPNAQAQSIAQLRNEIYSDLGVIRTIRNRIAHHEPIFMRNLQQDYDRILKLIRYQSKDTADWLENSQLVTDLLLNKP